MTYKKLFIFVSLFCSLIASGCSLAISSHTPESSPTVSEANQPEASAAPVGGDSNINAWRYVTNGTDLYYTREDPKGLRRIAAPFSEETVVWPDGYNWVCLVGEDIYLWSYADELYRIDAEGNTRKLIAEDNSVSGMWYFEGSLYYLVQDDYGMNTIKSFNLATNETQTYDETVSGMYPDFAVAAGYMYYTAPGPDFDEFAPDYLLVRLPVGGGEADTVAEKVLSFKVYNGKLYCLMSDETGTTALYGIDPANGEQVFVRSGVGLPLCIDGQDIYYTQTSDEGDSLVKATLKGGEPVVLFEGHFASNELIVFGDHIYFDEWDGMTMNKYIGAKDGSALDVTDNVFPYAAPDQPVTAPVGTSYLYLQAGDTLTSCFKLYDADGYLVWTELLEPGENKTVSFDSGQYYLKIGEGVKWISDEKAFGPDGTYSSTALFSFLPGQSYTIGSGTQGDFHADSQDGFVGN